MRLLHPRAAGAGSLAAALASAAAFFGYLWFLPSKSYIPGPPHYGEWRDWNVFDVELNAAAADANTNAALAFLAAWFVCSAVSIGLGLAGLRAKDGAKGLPALGLWFGAWSLGVPIFMALAMAAGWVWSQPLRP